MEVHLKRTIYKTGGSLALTIPEEVAKELDLKEGTEVEIDVEKGYGLFKKVE